MTLHARVLPSRLARARQIAADVLLAIALVWALPLLIAIVWGLTKLLTGAAS
jgi:hypothetical protein